MYRLSVIIAFILAVTHVLSQTYIPTKTEDNLFQLFDQFGKIRNVEESRELNDSILIYMQEKLVDPISFTYRFDSLRKRAGILDPGDGQFRIFTWNIPISVWDHEYYGIMQVLDKDGDSCRIFVLSNRIREIPDILNSETGSEMWPGVLYYDIRRNKSGKNVFYTLMGFSFNDRWSDKKIIEALHFDENMDPRFGKPVFNTPDGIQHRVVFEFSGDVAMSLRYNPDMKMIVYDHLEPIEPELAAHPRFYAPDFSYDGYKFRRGMWEFRADLDVRNR